MNKKELNCIMNLMLRTDGARYSKLKKKYRRYRLSTVISNRLTELGFNSYEEVKSSNKSGKLLGYYLLWLIR